MTIRPITLAATVLLALAVAGCVTTKEQQARLDRADQLHRSAPAWMNNVWEAYRRQTGIYYGVLAVDKKMRNAGWIYCESNCQGFSAGTFNTEKNFWAVKAVQHCNSRVRQSHPGEKPECAVYAVKGEIVWKGAWPWVQGGYADPSAKRDPSSVTTEKRTFTLSWVGSTDVYRGTMWFEQNLQQGSGRMFGSVMGHDCEGKFLLTSDNRGEWEADCGEGWVSAMGEFTGKGHGLGTTGTGTDDQGRMVEFVIDAARK